MEAGSGKAPERDFLDGSLLLAMPNMNDPRFEQAVILMCAHTDDHAMGVIVNKPLDDITFGALLDQLDMECGVAAADDPVLFGGPVERERGFVVHTLDYRSSATLPVTPSIGLTATRSVLSDMAGEGRRRAPRQGFLALGYAGWSAGQLESEIMTNAWLHCPADEELVFDTETDEKWHAALGRLGVTDAMFSSEWAMTRGEEAPRH
ncbi:MAG: YqgE/AlgH family protein [Pseudomonadota bacterium]